MYSVRTNIVLRVGDLSVRRKHWKVDAAYITHLLFEDRGLYDLWVQQYDKVSPTGLSNKCCSRLVRDIERYMFEDLIMFTKPGSVRKTTRQLAQGDVRMSAAEFATLCG